MFYVHEVQGDRAYVRGETAQHLRKVLRAERGQRYEVSDNESLYLAELADFGKDEAEFILLETLDRPQSGVRMHLFAALIKFDAFEWMLEKATELGVEEITPVYAQRCDKGLDQGAAKRSERWNRILLESGQQARRVTRPALHETVRFHEALRQQAEARLFCDEERTGLPLLTVARATQVAMLVGPEGGWEEQERLAAKEAGWLSVSLGPQVLRAETAALAALAVLQAAAAAR